MKVFYSDNYTAPKFAFDTTRKSKLIVDDLGQKPINGVELHEPEPLDAAAISVIHTPEYVEAVRTGKPLMLATSSGFDWDPGIWRMARYTNGGAVAAALAAMKDGVSGSLSSGLHHARRDHGAGFCTFNGLALSAHYALQAGAGRVLIVDLDAHCGGGTNSLIADNPDIYQVDLSTNAYDSYEPGPNTILKITDATGFRYVKECAAILEQGLAWLEGRDRGTPGLVLLNAGMDPHRPGDLISGIGFEHLQAREEMVFSRCRDLPVAFVLAGGYEGPCLSADDVVNLHRLTLEAATRYR